MIARSAVPTRVQSQELPGPPAKNPPCPTRLPPRCRGFTKFSWSPTTTLARSNYCAERDNHVRPTRFRSRCNRVGSSVRTKRSVRNIRLAVAIIWENRRFSCGKVRFPRNARFYCLRIAPVLLFAARSAVLDSRSSLARREIFAATADRWNFGLCATIPREPRQARKGATVTGQLRVPRSTRSSSHLKSGAKLRSETKCRDAMFGYESRVTDRESQMTSHGIQ